MRQTRRKEAHHHGACLFRVVEFRRFVVNFKFTSLIYFCAINHVRIFGLCVYDDCVMLSVYMGHAGDWVPGYPPL
jgi:hypothetical protein